MSDFSTEVRRRVHDARLGLVEARADGDEHLAQLLQDELDDVTRLAAEHQVALD